MGKQRDVQRDTTLAQVLWLVEIKKNDLRSFMKKKINFSFIKGMVHSWNTSIKS